MDGQVDLTGEHLHEESGPSWEAAGERESAPGNRSRAASEQQRSLAQVSFRKLNYCERRRQPGGG